MAIISDQLKIVFICVPKTGSTSVSRLLQSGFGGRPIPAQRVWNADKSAVEVDDTHTRWQQLADNEFFGNPHASAYRIIAVTRDPFDWAVSLYLFSRSQYALWQWRKYLTPRSRWPTWVHSNSPDVQWAHELAFEEYVARKFTVPRSVHYKFVAGAPAVTFLRFKSLQKDLSKLLTEQGASAIPELQHINKNRNRHHYSHYYTPKSRAIIEHIFAKDLRRFSYSFEQEPVSVAHRTQ